MKVKKPDFIIIGAPKAGTTSLANWLSQHPDVFFPRIKEPEFFTYAGQSHNPNIKSIPPYAANWQAYLQLFKNAKPKQKAGEASTNYYHSYQSPGLIKALLPSAKLVAVLRNPVERIYSHYLMDFGKGFTHLPFPEALAVEKDAQVGFGNKRIGCYAENLKRYLGFFPAHQIHVCLFDDLKDDQASFYREICAFLELRTDFLPEFQKINDYGKFHHPRWRQWLLNTSFNHPIRSLARWLLPVSIREHLHDILERHEPQAKPQMSAFVREELIAYYREDILELQNTLGRDLSTWLV